MGTEFAELAKTLTYPCSSFKVHNGMCMELMKLVDRIAKIFPEIEAARPGCSSGIKALCLLCCAVEKAKLLLQYCSESSKLYLAVTGEAIVRRCQRSRNLLEESLSQIQNMVPVTLAAEISRIVDELKTTTFVFDSLEEEAGKVMRDLLQQNASASGSLECSEVKTLQLATSRLRITSPKAILIEKRSIKKLLDKVGDSDHSRRKILKYFLYLLKKYGNVIMAEQEDVTPSQDEKSYSVRSQSSEVESHLGHGKYEAQTYISARPIPSEQFICPLSSRLMYDPVVIDSGLTFERTWIQKWFDEGNDICPITKVKLVHRVLTPNTNMKYLISKWCAKYGIAVVDPRIEYCYSSDTSSTSIASFNGSINVPLYVSNLSLRSLDTSFSSDASYNKVVDGLNLTPLQNEDDNENKIDLSLLAERKWETQCKVVYNAGSHLEHNDQVCHSLTCKIFVEPLLRFLREAQDLNDTEAQKIGCRLLLSFVSKSRNGISYLEDDAFVMLASLLDSEVTEEALAIIELLSNYPNCLSQIIASGALAFILDILDSQNRKLQEHAIKILCNLSTNEEIRSHITPSECIPILVPFLNDPNLALHILVTLKNISDSEEARVYIAEISGCLPSLAELLENGSPEEQESAAAILLSLCSQRLQYCDLVMNEGVIPALVNISINGNDKGKVIAQELLRILRDAEYSPDEQHCGVSDMGTSIDHEITRKEKKSSQKTAGLFGRKFSVFSKSQFSRITKGETRVKV